MSDTNELLKSLSAKIEEANGKFNAKAEEALKEAQKVGSLSTETKATVDKMATELNALRESEKTLKASLGELEQHVAQMPLNNAVQAAKTIGQQVISADVLKEINSSIQSSKRISIPVQAALTSTGVAEGVVEPRAYPVLMLRQTAFIYPRSDCTRQNYFTGYFLGSADGLYE